MEKNIALIGFMGCGKTTVGKVLASKMGAEFLDTDQQIQSDMHMSVNEIFSSYGEEYFRMLERNLCKLISVSKGLVIATGGGIIKSKSNLDSLKVSSEIVYIKSSAKKIYSNIKNDMSRPLLNGYSDKFKRIEELMQERIPLYEKCADITVDASFYQIEDTVNEIMSLFRENYI